MVPLPILGFHPKPRRCAKQSREPNPAFAPRPPDGGGGAWVQAMAKSRARAVYPYWGLRPKPRRCAKPSREPTLLSLRDRLMAEEVPGSSVAMRGQGRSYVAG